MMRIGAAIAIAEEATVDEAVVVGALAVLDRPDHRIRESGTAGSRREPRRPAWRRWGKMWSLLCGSHEVASAEAVILEPVLYRTLVVRENPVDIIIGRRCP
jgi:hypothetical protein